MSKEQQIEEIANITYDKIKNGFGAKFKDIAEAIYNAGYRKIDENCAVITKVEWKEYQKQAYSQVFETLTNRLEKYYSQYYSTMAVIMQAITDEIQTIVLDKYGEHLNVEQEIKELKQRSAKDVLEKLKGKCSDYLYDTFDGKNNFDIHIGEILRMIDGLLKEYEK